ncbi:hypothetical protein VIGAN_02149600, partial [Vigna angularis var. angularis]
MIVCYKYIHCELTFANFIFNLLCRNDFFIQLQENKNKRRHKVEMSTEEYATQVAWLGDQPNLLGEVVQKMKESDNELQIMSHRTFYFAFFY